MNTRRAWVLMPWVLVSSGLGVHAEATRTLPFMAEHSHAGIEIIAPQIDSKKLSFKIIDMGEFSDKDESIRIGFTDYEASDGVTVTYAHYSFESDTHARLYLGRVAHRASKVIGRELTRDKKGKILGERIQAIYGGDQGHPQMTEIIWTNGPDYQIIFSSSLQHILSFEKTLTH